MAVPTGMEAVVELPRIELRPWGLFTDVVPELDLVRQGTDRTGAGAKFMTRGDITPNAEEVDCVIDENFLEREIELTERVQLPFSTYNMIRCSTVTIEASDLNEWVLDDGRLLESAALTFAVTSSISPDHLNFAFDSDALAGGTDVVEVVGQVESGLGARIGNGRGFIFVPLLHLGAAIGGGAVENRDGILVSAGGHFVVSDAGHVMTDTVFGTGAMGYSLLGFRLITGPEGNLELSVNRRTAIVQAYGVVVFNPDHSVRSAIA
jgi:hypothetical protein